MLDLYTDGSSTVWLCAAVGSTGERIIVPISIPGAPTVGGVPQVGVTPPDAYDVTFYPDEGTP
jgi:hypothetical protein